MHNLNVRKLEDELANAKGRITRLEITLAEVLKIQSEILEVLAEVPRTKSK